MGPWRKDYVVLLLVDGTLQCLDARDGLNCGASCPSQLEPGATRCADEAGLEAALVVCSVAGSPSTTTWMSAGEWSRDDDPFTAKEEETVALAGTLRTASPLDPRSRLGILGQARATIDISPPLDDAINSGPEQHAGPGSAVSLTCSMHRRSSSICASDASFQELRLDARYTVSPVRDCPCTLCNDDVHEPSQSTVSVSDSTSVSPLLWPSVWSDGRVVVSCPSCDELDHEEREDDPYEAGLEWETELSCGVLAAWYLIATPVDHHLHVTALEVAVPTEAVDARTFPDSDGSTPSSSRCSSASPDRARRKPTSGMESDMETTVATATCSLSSPMLVVTELRVAASAGLLLFHLFAETGFQAERLLTQWSRSPVRLDPSAPSPTNTALALTPPPLLRPALHGCAHRTLGITCLRTYWEAILSPPMVSSSCSSVQSSRSPRSLPYPPAHHDPLQLLPASASASMADDTTLESAEISTVASTQVPPTSASWISSPPPPPPVVPSASGMVIVRDGRHGVDAEGNRERQHQGALVAPGSAAPSAQQGRVHGPIRRGPPAPLSSIVKPYSPTAPLGTRSWEAVVREYDLVMNGPPGSSPASDGSATTPSTMAIVPAAGGESSSSAGSTTTPSPPLFASGAGSHFLELYQPIGYLGRGADGQVLKVVHRITMSVYALKIVAVQSQQHAEQVMREARVLARLSHRNLVRYFHCWVEDVPLAILHRLERFMRTLEGGAGDADDDDDRRTRLLPAHPGVPEGVARVSDDHEGGSTSSDDPSIADTSWTTASAIGQRPPDQRVVASGSRTDELTPANVALAGAVAAGSNGKFRSDSSATLVLSADSSGERHQQPTPTSAAGGQQHKRHQRSRSGGARGNAMSGTARVFFLQMDHYETSLADWMKKERNPDTYPLRQPHSPDDIAALEERQKNLSIVLDVLTGLAVVHDHGLVHRDVKPANVFLDTASMHACVGDFGLTKAADASSSPSPADPNAPRTAFSSHRSAGQSPAFPSSPAQRQSSAALEDSEDVDAVGGFPRRPPRRLPSPAPVVMEGGLLTTGTLSHTVGVGSPLYAAPEQSAGVACDALCDAFAVGVLFVELYYCFRTASERIHTLRRAATGAIDEELVVACPELRIARALLLPDRSLRLSVANAVRLVRAAYLRVSSRMLPLDGDPL